MKVGQVLMTQNRAESQQIGIAIEHDSAIDAGHALQYRGWKFEYSLLMEQICG